MLICTVHLTVCYYHVTYALQSELTLSSCLNIKEIPARNRCDIWSISDCNGTRTKWLFEFRLLSLKLTVPVLSKEFLDIRATIDCIFTLKLVRDMIIIYSQMHRTDKHSQHSSVIWPVWLNGWAFVYELSGCDFKSRCFHLNFRYSACFEQGVLWHSCSYRI